MELIFIDAANKSAFKKKNWNIARNKMYFIINVIIARQNFSAHLITFFKVLLSSEYV